MERVLKKVPYHARLYWPYIPIKDRSYSLYDDETLKEREYDDGAEIVECERAYRLTATETEEEEEAEKENYKFFRAMEDQHDFVMNGVSRECHNRKLKWAIKDFKLLQVLSIVPEENNLPLPLSNFSCKYQNGTSKIEIEIVQLQKKEHGSSIARKEVLDLSLDTDDCDRPLSQTVNGYAVKYALLSDAARVRLEIMLFSFYNVSAFDISGQVSVDFHCDGQEYEKFLFKTNAEERPEHIFAGGKLLLCPSTLILPRRSKYLCVRVSLTDKHGGPFVNASLKLLCATMPAGDQQIYVLGCRGYAILNLIWGCLCFDQGVCTCAPATTVGFPNLV